MAALNTGDGARAQALLEPLHRRYPHNFEINESLGLLYAGGGNLREAAVLLAAAAQEQPNSDVAHANLGTALLKLGRTADAARELARAAALNPANARTQSALGQAYMLENQPCNAAGAFGAAGAAASTDPDLLYNAALALFNCGRAGQAASVLQRMPGLESSAQAQSLFGDIDEKLGSYKDAAQHYVNAARLDPTEANIYVLGTELLRHWTFDPAIKDFAYGLEKYPDSRRMRAGLGIAYYGNGNYDKAIPIFADLLAADPGNALYAELLGRNCTVLTEGQDPKCAALTTFAEQHPENATLATYAATSILHRPSDPAQLEIARRLLTSAIAAAPKLPEARYGMGLLLQTEGHWPESVPELEKAIALRPEYAQAHYRLALAYSHTGRKEAAQKEIALNRQYSQQQQNDLNARMQRITTFLVANP
jgi:tetratricopeptide (TPR) repeat protein